MKRTTALSLALLYAFPAYPQMVGSYTGGTGDPTAAAGFTAMTNAFGRAPTVALAYVDSQKDMSQWIASSQYEANNFKSAGWASNLIPMLGLPMAGPGQSADSAFKAFASGSQDAMLNGILKAWSDIGFQNIILRPGFEMNGGWFSWSVNASNAQDFIAAFQHIATVAHNYQNAIVTVVWNPNVGPSIPLDSYYPGDKAVDAIGLDTYGEPLNSDNSPMDSGSITNISLSNLIAFAVQHSKPFALPEIGAGKTNTSFPTQLAQALINNKANVLVAGFWDVDDSNGPMRWTDNSAPAAAWRQVANVIAGSKQVQFASVKAGPTGQTITTGTDIPPPVADPEPAPIVLSTPAPTGAPIAPPAPEPDAQSTAVSVDTSGAVYSNVDPGPQTITVTGGDTIVGAFGGPITATISGPGTSLSTGAYNDHVTVQSTGNSLDLGWGRDTITLAYSTPTPPQSTPITLAAAHATVDTAVGQSGNRFYLPAPQTGVLTINGTLAPNDILDLSKALAGTTWDHSAATMGQFVTTSAKATGTVVLVSEVPVALIVGKQTASLASLMSAD